MPYKIGAGNLQGLQNHLQSPPTQSVSSSLQGKGTEEIKGKLEKEALSIVTYGQERPTTWKTEEEEEDEEDAKHPNGESGGVS